jgi:hypothetical protein
VISADEKPLDPGPLAPGAARSQLARTGRARLPATPSPPYLATKRLHRRHPDLILVHTSWLNQVEIVLCIVQRKVLTPAVAGDLVELALRILTVAAGYRLDPRPFPLALHSSGLRAPSARTRPTHRRMTPYEPPRGPLGKGPIAAPLPGGRAAVEGMRGRGGFGFSLRRQHSLSQRDNNCWVKT